MSGTAFESKYANVLDSTMHYLEEGTGDPILLLHGNPTSSYVWRNIIPTLSTVGTCIAPDLIGMGRSDKPRIGYRFFDHAKYLEEFIHQLKLRNVTIVGHDWGGALGFYYAMHHERNVKAVAFFETIVKPLKWADFPADFKLAFRLFRTPVIGQFMIQGLNLFVNQILQKATIRRLTKDEMEEYARPFRTYGSRKPLWRMPNDAPIDGRPADVAEAAQKWSSWLTRSETPKLLLHASPGGLIGSTDVAWCRSNIRNLEVMALGEGIHYFQEDHPELVATTIADWLKAEVGVARAPHQSSMS